MDAVQSQQPSGAAGSVRPLQPADRATTALNLIALSDDLQNLGYSYEAYQVREVAARLLREGGGNLVT